MWHPIPMAVMITLPTTALLTVVFFFALALETVGRGDWSEPVTLGFAWTFVISLIIMLITGGRVLYSNR